MYFDLRYGIGLLKQTSTSIGSCAVLLISRSVWIRILSPLVIESPFKEAEESQNLSEENRTVDFMLSCLSLLLYSFSSPSASFVFLESHARMDIFVSFDKCSEFLDLYLSSSGWC